MGIFDMFKKSPEMAGPVKTGNPQIDEELMERLAKDATMGDGGKTMEIPQEIVAEAMKAADMRIALNKDNKDATATKLSSDPEFKAKYVEALAQKMVMEGKDSIMRSGGFQG